MKEELIINLDCMTRGSLAGVADYASGAPGRHPGGSINEIGASSQRSQQDCEWQDSISKSTVRPVLQYLFSILLCTCLVVGTPVSAAEIDPGLAGPYAVITSEYDFGDEALPASFSTIPGPIEFRATVTNPAGLADGPYPLVVILHGNHATCFNPGSLSEASNDWPCTGGQVPIPNHEGYAYLAQHLASHGFIVVSISANGINSRDLQTLDLGLIARAQLIYLHLTVWSIYNSSGGYPFGDRFVGKVDLNRVALIGHSMGGDGIAMGNYLNFLVGNTYGIEAMLMLAPTDIVGLQLNDVALAVFLPYCDAGIAPYGIIPGASYFDDALYNAPGDTGAKHMVVTAGANHAYYNTVWTPEIFPPGSNDDWFLAELFYGTGPDPECNTLVQGSGRLSAADQRASLLPYATAFLLEYLGDEAASGEYLDILTGDAPPPPSARTDRIYTSYHAPDNVFQRLDINRLDTPQNIFINSLGDLSLALGLSEFRHCGGGRLFVLPCNFLVPYLYQPHAALGQLRLAWDVPFSSFVNNIPSWARNVSGYNVIQFRAAVSYEDLRNTPGQPQDFVVRLTDGSGRSAAAQVSDWSQSLYYPPGALYPVNPKTLLNGVRIPLAAFIGVDLSDISQVSLEFGYLPGHEQGSIQLSGLAFSQ